MREIDMNVVVHLQVRRTASSLLGDLRFQNVGKDGAPLLTYHLPANGTVSNNVIVLELDGRLSPYIGPCIKRTPPAREDFVMLSPDQEITYTFDLSECYRISSVAASGQARYEAYHGDARLFGRLWLLRSNSAAFEMSVF